MQTVKSYLKGRPVSGALKLDIQLTEFQQNVLEKIRLIPMGQTRTYGEIAQIIGTPGGARAVGQVMNRNPLPLIFP
jgi:methylated-DNA-[protein]-cysteine S-methyltransferase